MATARRKAAPRMAGQIQATLRELAMPSATFTIAVEGPGPADQVTLPPRSQCRRTTAAGGQGRLRRRAGPDHAGHTVGHRRHPWGRWCSTRSMPESAAAPRQRWDRPWPSSVTMPRYWWSPTWPRWPPWPTIRSRCSKSERSGRTRTEVSMLDEDGRVDRAQPDAVGQPGQPLGPSSCPGVAWVARWPGRRHGDPRRQSRSGIRTAGRFVPLASSGARRGRPAATLRGTNGGRSTPSHGLGAARRDRRPDGPHPG